MNTMHAGHRTQRGVSLIELLVGITIGLLVSLAAMVTLLGARTSSVTVQDSVSLQQDASLVWRVLGHHLQQAGAVPLIPAPKGVPPNIDVIYQTGYAGLGNQGTPAHVIGADGTNGAPDTLTIAYTADTASGHRNCADTNQSEGTFINEFRVSRGSLVCRAIETNQQTERGLAMGVEDFQVTYAERTGTNTTYVATPAVWANVVAVRVCLQLAGSATGQAAAATQGCRGMVANDGRIRQAFWRVFTLRNANP